MEDVTPVAFADALQQHEHVALHVLRSKEQILITDYLLQVEGAVLQYQVQQPAAYERIMQLSSIINKHKGESSHKYYGPNILSLNITREIMCCI